MYGILDELKEHSVTKFYKHKYGGLYQLISEAKSSVDLSRHVVYKHLFPFEQEIWVRPWQEFTDGRFLLISAERAIDILLSDRELYKQIVKDLKAKS